MQIGYSVWGNIFRADPHTLISGGGGGTPGNSWWKPVPPGSSNPDLILDQKCHFLHPFSDLASKKLCHLD